jgi:hypothetical protein
VLINICRELVQIFVQWQSARAAIEVNEQLVVARQPGINPNNEPGLSFSIPAIVQQYKHINPAKGVAVRAGSIQLAVKEEFRVNIQEVDIHI